MKTALIAIPVIIIALWFTSRYLWNKKWRPWRQSKGIPTAGFDQLFKRVMIFIFVEDTEPFKKFPEIKLLNRKTVYLAILALTILVAVTSHDLLFTSLMLFTLLLTISLRVKSIFSARFATLQRMFEVAHSEFRYPKNAELNPWGYINIKKWDTLTFPGETVVSYPAAWRSDDPIKREAFQNHFDSTITDENTWIYKWDTAQGKVSCVPVTHIPSNVGYPGSENRPWDEIPMGVGAAGETIWQPSLHPHLLVCGTTGGGKSTAQRTLIFHCIQHPDRWRFLGIDLKRVELSPYKKYDDVVLGIAVTLEDALEVLRFGRDEMMSRYEEMEEIGVDHFMKLADPPYALMIMVDEAFMLMGTENTKNDEGKMRDEMHNEATNILGDIARLGRAAGLHLVLATQRPDARVILGELKENLSVRYAAGRMKSTASRMVLDSDGATRIPGEVKGRAIISVNGNEHMTQGYFAESTWIDEWLEKKSGGKEKKPVVTLTKQDSQTLDSIRNSDFFNGTTESNINDVINDDSHTLNQEQIGTVHDSTTTMSQPITFEKEEVPFIDENDYEPAFSFEKIPSVPNSDTRNSDALPFPSNYFRPSLEKTPTAINELPQLADDRIEEEELVDPFAIARPNISGGLSRTKRSESEWDDDMESIFLDIPQNNLPTPPKKKNR